MITHVTPLRFTLALQIALLTILLLVGCSSDDPVTPDPVGTIVVDPTPDHRSAGWSLDIPGGQIAVGNGDTTLTDMPTGSYTLTWQPVSGWLTPDPVSNTQSLKSGDTVTFAGTYVIDDPDQAVLIIDPEPDGVNTYWRLEYEGTAGGIVGSGDSMISHQRPGVYTVFWGDVVGWVTPDSVRLTVVSPDTFTFPGVYTVDYAAYPSPTIGWQYGEAPIPAGFPMIIGGGAYDEHDGWLAPEALTWISDQDGIVATGESRINGGDLSIGTHQIRLLAEDMHGLVGEDTVTVQVVPVPAQSPTATLTLPDWGVYNTSQEAPTSPVFGWDGTDPASTSGHPAYYRFLFKSALLPDNETYADTQTQFEANLDFLVSSTDPDWSPWLPHSDNELDRRIMYPDLPILDSQNRQIHYLFAIQAWSETGAISSTWFYSGNVANFYVVP